MKILTVTEVGTWIDPHIIQSLRDAGHTVEPYYYGPSIGTFYGRRGDALRRQKNAELLATATRLAQRQDLDLIFCYVYDDFLTEATAEALRALGRPMVNFNVDMVCQWYRQTKTAKYFTRVLCAQTAHMQDMERYGARTMLFPMAARIRSEPHDMTFIPATPVTFMGSPSPFRANLLRRLIDAGIPVSVYGGGWSKPNNGEQTTTLEKTISDVRDYALCRLRAEGIAPLAATLLRKLNLGNTVSSEPLPNEVLKGFVPENAMDRLFAQSPINIGVTRITGDDPEKPGRTQMKLRDFEVPAAGGFYLVEETDELSRHFEPGVEVATWRTASELIEQIRHYLSHETERRAIAEAGRQRTLRDHTWARRFEALFSELGLP